MNIAESLENSCLFVKIVSQTIENETKEQRGEFLGVLLGTLGTSSLENMLASK